MPQVGVRHADLSLQASLVAQIFSAVGQGIHPGAPSTSVTDREASMILFRIVFAVTAILLTRNAFAEPGMWIGTAPFCSGSPAACTDLGMTYVKSDSTGDGGKCEHRQSDAIDPERSSRRGDQITSIEIISAIASFIGCMEASSAAT